jgi:hypothetical protein
MTDEPNPALVPEEETAEPQEKQYKVVGTAAVFGHAPGETFSATLPTVQEANFLEYGQLAVSEETVTPDQGDTPAEGDQAPAEESQPESTDDKKE